MIVGTCLLIGSVAIFLIENHNIKVVLEYDSTQEKDLSKHIKNIKFDKHELKKIDCREKLGVKKKKDIF